MATKTITLSEIKRLLEKDSTLFRQFPQSIKENNRVIEIALEINGSNYYYLPAHLQQKKEYVLQAATANENPLKIVPRLFNTDRQVVEAIVKNDGNAIIECPMFKNDVSVAMYAVQQDGMCLQFLSDELRDSKGIVKAAILQNENAIKYASGRLKADKEIQNIINKPFDIKRNSFLQQAPIVSAEKNQSLYEPNISLSKHRTNVSKRDLNMRDER